MTTQDESGKADKELSAIDAILRALDGLDGSSIKRVLDYVLNRLSISRSAPIAGIAGFGGPSPSIGATATARPHQPSIRDLKEEKKPDSSNQMAALVAFYLSEVAPEGESKPLVNTADIDKYFKQARFDLPKKVAMTLPNAAAAGYLDAVGDGFYKLNPVGYNLIAHALPRDLLGSSSKKSQKASTKKK